VKNNHLARGAGGGGARHVRECAGRRAELAPGHAGKNVGAAVSPHRCLEGGWDDAWGLRIHVEAFRSSRLQCLDIL
jgi:hypothetical protein